MQHENIPLGKIGSTKDLGRVVRERRKALNLTQSDLSGITGVGNRFIVDLENGKPTIQFEKALAVMKWLGIEMLLAEK